MSSDWPDPTPEMLDSLLFNSIWQEIKTWDINVPRVDGDLYSGATGNHARAILDSIYKELDGSAIPIGEERCPPE